MCVKASYIVCIAHTEGKPISKPLSVRIPDDLRDRLDVLAKAERRTVSNLVAVLLESALDARRDEPLGPAQHLSSEERRKLNELIPVLLKEAERRGMSDLVEPKKGA